MPGRARPHGVVTLLALIALLGSDAVPAAAEPATAEALYAAGRAALAAQDFATARRHFAALAARHPDNADYLLGHGQSLLASGDAPAALVPLERARDLAPTYLDVLQVLASAYLAAGRRADAHATYAAAGRHAPAADWVERGLRASAPQAPERSGRTRATAAPLLPRRLTFVTGFEATLTERDDTWHEQLFGVDYAWTQRGRFGLRAARSERFGRDDTLLEMTGSVPLGARLTLAARAVVSPTHRVRVEEGGMLEASLALARGFVLSAGGGRMEYDSGPSDLVTTTLEHYAGAFRLAYTATFVQPVRGEWTPAHRWAGGWYYADESFVNLSLAYGAETDETLLGAATLEFDTWGAGINGRHWLNRHFAFDYAGGYNGLESKRGDHLDRTTFYLGVALRH